MDLANAVVHVIDPAVGNQHQRRDRSGQRRELRLLDSSGHDDGPASPARRPPCRLDNPRRKGRYEARRAFSAWIDQLVETHVFGGTVGRLQTLRRASLAVRVFAGVRIALLNAAALHRTHGGGRG